MSIQRSPFPGVIDQSSETPIDHHPWGNIPHLGVIDQPSETPTYPHPSHVGNWLS